MCLVLGTWYNWLDIHNFTDIEANTNIPTTLIFYTTFFLMIDYVCSVSWKRGLHSHESKQYFPQFTLHAKVVFPATCLLNYFVGFSLLPERDRQVFLRRFLFQTIYFSRCAVFISKIAILIIIIIQNFWKQ